MKIKKDNKKLKILKEKSKEENPKELVRVFMELSRTDIYYIQVDIPHGKKENSKANNLLDTTIMTTSKYKSCKYIASCSLFRKKNQPILCKFEQPVLRKINSHNHIACHFV